VRRASLARQSDADIDKLVAALLDRAKLDNGLA
jgi:hypothetical protein